MNRVAEVNRVLKARGEPSRLRKGAGYYYFDGWALQFASSSVYVQRSDALSVAEWVAEYDAMKADYLKQFAMPDDETFWRRLSE